MLFSRRYSLDDAFARLHLTDGGLAQRRLPLNVLRATSVRVRTSLSAELLPPLYQLSVNDLTEGKPLVSRSPIYVN